MPTELSTYVQDLIPENTVLFLGSGSSLPSHAPSVNDIVSHLSKTFHQISDGFTLAEISTLIEQKTRNRRKMIEAVKSLFVNLQPTGGLLNIPHYDWKNIYTTNYDELVEEAYKRVGKELITFASDFDFTVRGASESTRLFKIHGTIGQDTSTGHLARIMHESSELNAVRCIVRMKN